MATASEAILARIEALGTVVLVREECQGKSDAKSLALMARVDDLERRVFDDLLWLIWTGAEVSADEQRASRLRERG